MNAPRLIGLTRRLYPRRYRDALYEDMLAVFAERRRLVRRDRGRVAALLYSLRTTLEIVIDGLRVRFASGDGPGRRKSEERGGAGHDFRQALLALRSAPGHGSVVVLTLALGVGSATAMFSVVDHVRLEPLPHPEPERLVRVWRTLPQFDWRRSPISAPTLEDWRRRSSSFELLGGFSGAHPVTYVGGEFPRRVSVGFLTRSMLEIIGVRTLLGRLPDEREFGSGESVALLSEPFWRQELGADPSIVGRALPVVGSAPTVVGVLPAGIGMLPGGVDYWLPAGATPAAGDRGSNFLQAVGRLAPGATLAGAQAEMAEIATRLADEHPETSAGSGVWIEAHRAFLLRDIDDLLLVLAGCAGLSLAVVCASLSGLTLTRVQGRGRELAVRAALGATAARLVRQLLAESAILGMAGGALGALVAQALLGAFVSYGPQGIPRSSDLGVDPTALLFSVGVAVVSGLVLGTGPAFRVASLARGEGLYGRQTGAMGRTGRSGHRALRGLAVGQVALSTVLLVVAALLGNSFMRLAAVDPGFVPEGRLSAHVSLPPSSYSDPARVGAFFDELLARLESLPGVVESGATWALPFQPTYGSGTYRVEGQPAPEGSELLIGLVPVRGDYFAAMGIPILRGRSFGEAEPAAGPNVAVVNETMAERHWPGGEAVGARFFRGDNEYTILGVVPDVKRDSLAGEVAAEAFLPHTQASWATELYVVLHADQDAPALAAAIRSTLRELDPELPATAIAPLDELIDRTLIGPRFRTLLIGGFAVFAALLALLGVYGVVRLVVASRTAEIGLRMALGAGCVQTARRVVAAGLLLAIVGVGVGLPSAWLAAGAVEGLVFGITPTDPLTYATVTLGLLAVAGLASWFPARRASRIDPVIALRG